MPTGNEPYKGREQSQIKHFILKHYLIDMAFKVGQSKKDGLTAINYVDGFSGPWETQDTAQYSDTSFRLAIKTLREVRRALRQVRHERLKIRFVFCEKNRETHARLVEAISVDRDVEIHCIHGKFESKLENVSRICCDGFTFCSIDPRGFKLDTHAISCLLRNRHGEFLWNYMADFANRFLTREGLEDAYGELLAEQRWVDRINDPSLAGLRNEERVLTVLRERLKELNCASYILDFPVLRPRENRILYRLLFGTRSAVGVSVFRSVQKKAEVFQAEIRDEVRQEELGSLLISPKDHAQIVLAREGIDGTRAVEAAPKRVLEFLQSFGPVSFRNLLGPILETERLTEPCLKDILGKMRAANAIHYELPGRTRKPSGDVMIYLCW